MELLSKRLSTVFVIGSMQLSLAACGGADDTEGNENEQLIVEQSNAAPTADAGGPYSVVTGSNIQLDGSGSNDSDGAIALYEWDLDGDGTYDDALSAAATYQAQQTGRFTVSLKVTDDNGLSSIATAAVTVSAATAQPLTYPIVDTGQVTFYSAIQAINEPAPEDAFYGQDAHFHGNQPSYTQSSDALTVYDEVTALTWTRSADWDGDGDIDYSDKMSLTEARSYPDLLNAQRYGGYSDWRLPSIKELYSLMNFSGTDPSASTSNEPIPLYRHQLLRVCLWR